jgi:hypothetical protein
MQPARTRGSDVVWSRGSEARMPGRSPRLKLLPYFGVFALALLLAGCDRCGDLIKSQGGNTPLVCKGDGPKPQ